MNKQRKLCLGDFKREGISGSFGHYFSYIFEDGRELCLESCLNGYDVAIYDKEKNLIGEKICTEIVGMLEMQIIPGFSMGTGIALEKAIKIANNMIQKLN
jgi:hypothetical protein